MAPNYEQWTKRVAQVGLVSKGVVYLIFGTLIIMATYIPSGEPVGLFEIIQYIITLGWFGRLIVALMAMGLLCYSAWKYFQMVLNVEGYERNYAGYFIRFTWLGPLLLYLFLSGHSVVQLYNWYVGNFLYYPGEPGSLQRMLYAGWGKWVIGIISIGLLGNAITLFYLAFTGKYRIMLTGRNFYESSPRLARLTGMAGYISYGFTLLLLAVLFALAIYYSDMSYANGQESLFLYLIIQPWGKLLLTIIALGTVCYGAYFLLASFYRWREATSDDSST